MFKGLTLLIGGLFWATVNLWEWRRWRTGRPSLLPWGRKTVDTPRTEMNRIIESWGAIGNVLLGVIVAALGLALLVAG